MKNKEAINILKLMPKQSEAIKKAIEVLEQESCEDAVSRDAFITRYKEWMRSERGKIPNDDTLAIRVIESLPSVMSTRKKRMNEQTIKDIDRAFKALEERDELLEKIRAEIEQKCCITVGRENDPAVTLYDIFQIIDKYKVGDKE